MQVLSVGPIFLDLTFTGLDDSGPQLGNEIYASHFTITCGGAANVAIATAKLGLTTGLVADRGEDEILETALKQLTEAGVELHLATHRNWQTPTTVLLNYAQDRALVTYETEPPKSVLKQDWQMDAELVICSLRPEKMPWLATARSQDIVVIADIGTDPTGSWNLADLPDLTNCQVFTPNLSEARAYTKKTDIAEILEELTKWVPLAIVTMGEAGAAAMERGGEPILVAAPKVDVVDAGGAGEVFNAALAYSIIHRWELEDGLKLAVNAAALSITRSGGAYTAPTLKEVLATLE